MISQKAFSVMAVPLVVGLCSIASAAKKMGFGLYFEQLKTEGKAAVSKTRPNQKINIVFNKARPAGLDSRKDPPIDPRNPHMQRQRVRSIPAGTD